MSLRNSEEVILSAKRLVEADKRSEIRLSANGGNSILVLCEPEREMDYIKTIYSLLPKVNYEIIDLNNVLNNYIEVNKQDLIDRFDLLRGSLNQIFKSTDDGNDLFSVLINKINESLTENKIPVLIHSGALFGTGIDNIHIIENAVVMKAKLPIIILYPATKDKDSIYFLGKRPASKYRCMIVE